MHHHRIRRRWRNANRCMTPTTMARSRICPIRMCHANTSWASCSVNRCMRRRAKTVHDPCMQPSTMIMKQLISVEHAAVIATTIRRIPDTRRYPVTNWRPPRKANHRSWAEHRRHQVHAHFSFQSIFLSEFVCLCMSISFQLCAYDAVRLHAFLPIHSNQYLANKLFIPSLFLKIHPKSKSGSILK